MYNRRLFSFRTNTFLPLSSTIRLQEIVEAVYCYYLLMLWLLVEGHIVVCRRRSVEAVPEGVPRSGI